jgi:hypothetical protein
LSEHLGLTQITNPKKAFSPVSTNAVSLGTGIVLGMCLIGKGENFQDENYIEMDAYEGNRRSSKRLKHGMR